jgi:hypothetical protein
MLSLTPKFIRLHYETRGALQNISEYCNSLADQQYPQAYRFAGEAFRQALPYDKFVTLYEGLERRYGTLKTVSRKGYQVNGHGSPTVWRAVVDEDFVYEKGTIRFEFVLHKERDHWTIFSAEQL